MNADWSAALELAGTHLLQAFLIALAFAVGRGMKAHPWWQAWLAALLILVFTAGLVNAEPGEEASDTKGLSFAMAWSIACMLGRFVEFRKKGDKDKSFHESFRDKWGLP